jgi:hypothetical protein
MNEYKKSYDELQSILNDCITTSQKYAGIPSPSSSHFYSSLIFTKLCTSSVTALSICPSPKKTEHKGHWDCASVATLTRGIIETYLLFFYLCIDNCTKAEWEARWRLMNLHDHMSRLKMFKVMKNSDEQVTPFEAHTNEVKADLKNTAFFKTLDEKLQRHYLKGNTAFLKSQDEIITASGGCVDEFRMKYRFLSNHTHSYPMGFYRMVENGHGTGIKSQLEIEYTAMCLNWITEYLTKAKSSFEELWVENTKESTWQDLDFSQFSD